jgi:hypothetical protein
MVNGVTSPDTFISVWFREALLFQNLQFGDISQYIFTPEGSFNATLVIGASSLSFEAPNATNVPFTFNVTGNNTFTLVAHGTADTAAVSVFQDNLPTQGNFLRVVNFNPNSVTVIVNNNQTIASNLGSEQASNFTQLQNPPLNVTITTQNGTIPLLTLLSNISTIFVLPPIQGQEAILAGAAFTSNDVLANATAKIRLIHAWPLQGTTLISLLFDGNLLFSNIAYGQLSDYAVNAEPGLHHIVLAGPNATVNATTSASTQPSNATATTATGTTQPNATATAGTTTGAPNATTAGTTTGGTEAPNATTPATTPATTSGGAPAPSTADLWFVIGAATTTTIAKINPTTQDLPLAFYGTSSPTPRPTFPFWLFFEVAAGNTSSLRVVNVAPSFASVTATLGNATVLTASYLEETSYQQVSSGTFGVAISASSSRTNLTSSATQSVTLDANQFRTMWILDALPIISGTTAAETNTSEVTSINVTLSIDRPNDPVRITITGIENLSAAPPGSIPIEDWFFTFTIAGAIPTTTSRSLSVIATKPGRYCFTNPPVFITNQFTFGIQATGISLPTFTPLPPVNVAVINAAPVIDLGSAPSVSLFGRRYRIRY